MRRFECSITFRILSEITITITVTVTITITITITITYVGISVGIGGSSRLKVGGAGEKDSSPYLSL